MDGKKVLWVDDEIDLLKSHIIFLNSKGYDITPATNGDDAIVLVQRENFDVVMIDEMMPGRDGLSTLLELKKIKPNLPVIMITKNEEESLMEEAIGSKIDDYLTKPVNPSQILLSLKKLTESKKLTKEKLSLDYTSEFPRINELISGDLDWKQWSEIHHKLSNWGLQIDRHPDEGLQQSLEGLRESCNTQFARFIEANYMYWLHRDDRPQLSPDIVGKYLLPHLRRKTNCLLIIIDCMRLDQWLAIEDLLAEFFHIDRDYYFSILPSATPYSRNALFSGLFPRELEIDYPDIWQKELEDETSFNRYERQLLENQLARAGIALKPEPRYFKILDPEEGLNLERRISSLFNLPLISIVVNFVDMLAHGRASSDVLKEMIPNDSAYRSIVRSWFEHSSLFSILKAFSRQENTAVIMTSDHGAIRCFKGTKVISDREASTNLRYKYGRNLKCDHRHALFIANPQEYKLPRLGLNINYIIAKGNYYFVYPTNYHKYLNFFKNSLQHGGISLEEMVLPVYTLKGK
jgi:CheY-like chemotaxis protein